MTLLQCKIIARVKKISFFFGGGGGGGRGTHKHYLVYGLDCSSIGGHRASAVQCAVEVTWCAVEVT